MFRYSAVQRTSTLQRFNGLCAQLWDLATIFQASIFCCFYIKNRLTCFFYDVKIQVNDQVFKWFLIKCERNSAYCEDTVFYGTRPSIVKKRLTSREDISTVSSNRSTATQPVHSYTLGCRTAKTQCRKFVTNIPKKGISRRQPNFHIHVSVSDFIFSHDRRAYSAAGIYVDSSWE